MEKRTGDETLLLDQVLPKLRPFQREAFEFATKGEKYARQLNSKTMATASGSPTENKPKTSSSSSTTASLKTHDDSSLQGKGRLLLADEMGLGKTVTSLAIMAAYEQEWPLLILCPASLRYSWPSEIEKFFPALPVSSVYVVQGFQDVEFASKKNIRVVVVTYSLIQNRSAVTKVLQEQNYKCIIADESHNLKQKASQRSRLILPVLSAARRLLLLSGTPALARPVELWTQLFCLSPKLFGNWTTYTKKYCNPRCLRYGPKLVWDYSGSSNVEELHAKLKNVMVRRLKCDVLQELPPKQRTIVPVTISAKEKASCQKVMLELKEKKSNLKDFFGEIAAEKASWEAKSALMQAYQATGRGKAKAVADYVLDWLSGSSEKILVFFHHQAVVDVVDEALLSKCPNSHIRIDGKVPTDVRAQLVTKFQTCSRVRVALLSMTAAGVGLTLTAASTILFAELHWTPGVMAQAEDRAHRIGQSADRVQILYCICRDGSCSIDNALWSLLGKKIGTLGQIVDGKAEKPYLYSVKANETALAAKHSQSVQDELTTFFAETALAEQAKKREKGSIVKGSIQSFFLKKTPAASAKQKPPMSQGDGQMMEGTKSFSAKKPASLLTTNKAVNEETTWTCSACTFINKSADSQQHRACSMCGTPCKTETDKQEDQISWKCNNCTFENTQTRSRISYYPCEMCGDPFLESQQSVANVAGDSSESEIDDAFDTPFVPRMTRPARVSMGSDSVVVIDGAEHAEPTSSAAVELVNITKEEKMARLRHEKRCNRPFSTASSELDPSCIIVIDCDDQEKPKAHPTSQSALKQIKPPPTTLAFSVSKNSGRITIHYAETKTSSMVNFDVEDVVTSETADQLLDARVKRVSTEESRSVKVEFDPKGLQCVLNRLEEFPGGLSRKQNEEELTCFVLKYLALREVEKKVIKESGQPFSHRDLLQSVARLMQSSCNGTTDRYGGGARKKAMENAENGTVTETDIAVLNKSACAWCAKLLSAALVETESTYCSQKCAEEGRLRHCGSSGIRTAMFALDGGKCALCGFDGHSLYEQISALQPAERLNKLLSVGWKLPRSSKAMENLLQNPKEGDFWEVDHIRAVAEGGGGCGLDNLRTLCVPCHARETEKLRARLKLRSPCKKNKKEAMSCSNKRRKQMDIRSALFSQR